MNSVQDLTAINVKKTGHRKKILSESAKLEKTTVFPTDKPVSLHVCFFFLKYRTRLFLMLCRISVKADTRS